MNRVLVLGSGYVCGPLVEYLTREARVAVTIGEHISCNAVRLVCLYACLHRPTRYMWQVCVVCTYERDQ